MKISVIIPIYNVSAFLSKTVHSVCTQTEQNLEILLVDDGSTDGSGVLCDEFASADNRIRVIHKQNGGLSSARNAGLDVATGDYILFLDGDDYLAPNAAELLLDVAAKHELFDFIQFYYTETDGSWTADPRQEANARLCSDVKDMFRYLYAKGGVAASACTKLYRRTLLDDLRFQEGITHEDEEFITRLLPRCKNVVYTELALYGYVMREGSIVHKPFHPHKMDIFPIMDERIVVLNTYGLYDLVAEARKGQFMTAARLYCEARRDGYATEQKALMEQAKRLTANQNLPLTGQYRLLFELMKWNKYAIELYCQVRRLLGKE